MRTTCTADTTPSADTAVPMLCAAVPASSTPAHAHPPKHAANAAQAQPADAKNTTQARPAHAANTAQPTDAHPPKHAANAAQAQPADAKNTTQARPAHAANAAQPAQSTSAPASIADTIATFAISLHPSLLHKSPLPYAAQPLTDIAAILFDIYGTILLSAAGEIGNTVYSYGRSSTEIEQVFSYACALGCHRLFCGTEDHNRYHLLHKQYVHSIANVHAQLKQSGIQYPEVDIRDIWRNILTTQQETLALTPSLLTPDRIATFAIVVELYTNPIQLAPHIGKTLQYLTQQGYPLGIISNAQFYTEPILAHVTQQSLAELGFQSMLHYWSFEHRIAKPALYCFESTAKKLQDNYGIAPHKTLFIGNDLRNDIIPAARAGFKTCLYCGDTRSIKLYPENDNIGNHRADTWIDSYDDLPRLLG